MARLRQTVLVELREILDETVFTSDDFDIILGEDDKDLVNIKLKYGNGLFFSIEKSNNDTYIFTRSPGSLYEMDKIRVASVHDAFKEISDWANEARNELKAQSPIFRDVDDLKLTIEEHFRINPDNNSEEFSAIEINSLKEKFDTLLKRFEAFEEENKITQKQFEDFKAGIEQVSEDLEHYPKNTWIKTASNKIYKTITSIGKSKEGRAILAGSAKKLIGIE